MDYKARRLSDRSVRNLTMIVDPAAFLVQLWEQQWQDYLDDHDARSLETDHWSWRTKSVIFADRPNSVMIGAECAGRCQGMLVLSWPKSARLAPGEETAYVEYLETAPWNRPAVAGEREFTGIASNLLYVAYDLSVVLGYNGRLSLASLEASEHFYERIGMVRSGVGAGIDSDLAYFEFREAAAARFRNG